MNGRAHPRETTLESYRRRFGAYPTCLARAPGRVNLIGEHTDYNEGLVLPFAIEQSLWVAGGPGPRGRVTVHSMARRQSVSFSITDLVPATKRTWQNYVRGAVGALDRAGIAPPGARLCIGGDLPAGGGLSSSAALSVGCALALATLGGAALTPIEAAYLGQGVEHEFAGTQAGIMDPYVCAFGRAGHAVLLDCRSNTHTYVPLSLEDVRFLVIDSGVRHALASGGYLQRVLECRRAAAAIAQTEPSVGSLRDVTPEMLALHSGRLDEVLRRRAAHVVSENARVVRVAQALRDGAAGQLGDLLFEGHISLHRDYEVSCPEIEEIVQRLSESPGVLGARMIGGGFGGMVLALTTGSSAEEIAERLEATYNRQHAVPAGVFEVAPAGGAECRRL